MKQKLLLYLSFFVFPLIGINGQEKSDFNIAIPQIKAGDSNYNRLVYIESRANPYDMGIVYINMWEGFQEVTLSIPLEQQLASLIQSVTFQNEEKGKLAVQMRTLFFSFGEENLQGKGKCNLRMTLYKADNKDTFYFLNTIDTVLVSEEKEIRNLAGSVIASFITDNLPYLPYEDEAALTMEQVMDIDFYEKNSIPFYTESFIPDGIYFNYRSLKNLSPDETPDLTTIDTGKDSMKDIKIPDTKKPGKTKKLKSKDAYAIVANGIPYIGYEGSFRKAHKNDGGWWYVIMQKTTSGNFSLNIGVGGGNRRSAGGVGIGIPIGGKTENYEIFIDQLNGDFYWGGKISK
ncbi:MAG: hypothetical protein LBV43_14250 [Prevotella sp.]|jgi:hypothetical protein|nr:hypothetical protein [Prevotella sp.]